MPFLRNKEIRIGPFFLASTNLDANHYLEGEATTFGRSLPSSNSLLFSFGSKGIPVRISGDYQTEVIPDLATKPKSAEVTALVQITMEFWDQHFHHAFAESGVVYKGLEMDVQDIRFEAGIPEERFNYFIAFSTVLFFDESSVDELPHPDAVYNDMITANFEHYIRQYVRKVAQFYPEQPKPISSQQGGVAWSIL